MRDVNDWVYVASPLFGDFVRAGKIISITPQTVRDGARIETIDVYTVFTGPGDIIFRVESELFDTATEAKKYAEEVFE